MPHLTPAAPEALKTGILKIVQGVQRWVENLRTTANKQVAALQKTQHRQYAVAMAGGRKLRVEALEQRLPLSAEASEMPTIHLTGEWVDPAEINTLQPVGVQMNAQLFADTISVAHVQGSLQNAVMVNWSLKQPEGSNVIWDAFKYKRGQQPSSVEPDDVDGGLSAETLKVHVNLPANTYIQGLADPDAPGNISISFAEGSNNNMFTATFLVPGGIPGYGSEDMIIVVEAPIVGVFEGTKMIELPNLSPPPNPLPGDYDFSGEVDEDDFLTWRMQYGNSAGGGASAGDVTHVGMSADGNQNGMVDAADYSIWRDNSGQTFVVGADAASASALEPVTEKASIPEPSVETMPEAIAQVSAESNQSVEHLFSWVDTTESMRPVSKTYPAPIVPAVTPRAADRLFSSGEKYGQDTDKNSLPANNSTDQENTEAIDRVFSDGPFLRGHRFFDRWNRGKGKV